MPLVFTVRTWVQRQCIFIAAEHIQFQTVFERMWAKHPLFVIDTVTSAVWCLTIVIRTGNIKTEDQYWMNFISWKCWTGKRRVMALHDIDCLISIISEHSTWGGGTIPRHGQCEHTVAAALACGPRRSPSIATPPPSHRFHFSWQSVSCSEGSFSTLPRQCQGILSENCN